MEYLKRDPGDEIHPDSQCRMSQAVSNATFRGGGKSQGETGKPADGRQQQR